jgi:hypothetical protein
MAEGGDRCGLAASVSVHRNVEYALNSVAKPKHSGFGFVRIPKSLTELIRGKAQE